MAPRNLGTSILEAYKDERDEKNNSDQNGNTDAPSNRPFSREEVNEKSRKIIQNCLSHLDTNLNVLVLGAKDSGKSSLINSMNMALMQEWQDVAKMCPGRRHTMDDCVMFKQENRRTGRVVFRDARGFDELYDDEQLAIILRYILEGRIPSRALTYVLLMSAQSIKHYFHRVEEPHRSRIDLVLFVSDPTTPPCTRLLKLLQQAICRSKQTFIKDIPVVSVVTKMDKLSSPGEQASSFSEYDFEQSMFSSSDCEECYSNSDCEQSCVSKRSDKNNNNNSVFQVKKVSNYVCELDEWSDLSVDPSSMEPCPELDTGLLSIWKEIVTRTAACGGDRRKRNFAVSPKTGLVGCLPRNFARDLSRLKLI